MDNNRIVAHSFSDLCKKIKDKSHRYEILERNELTLLIECVKRKRDEKVLRIGTAVVVNGEPTAIISFMVMPDGEFNFKCDKGIFCLYGVKEYDYDSTEKKPENGNDILLNSLKKVKTSSQFNSIINEYFNIIKE